MPPPAAPREGEVDGKDYHFLTPKDFAEKVKNGAFVEYEEVYEGLSYGHAVQRSGEVCGATAAPRFLTWTWSEAKPSSPSSATSALSIFVMPPSMLVLEDRLRGRGTEDEAALEKAHRQVPAGNGSSSGV